MPPFSSSSSSSPPTTPQPSSASHQKAAGQPRKVLLPSIPTRKTSHPDARAAAGQGSNRTTPLTLSQLIAQAARARAVKQAESEPQTDSASLSAEMIREALQSNAQQPAPQPQAKSHKSQQPHQRQDSVMSVLSSSSLAEYAQLIDSDALEVLRASAQLDATDVQSALEELADKETILSDGDEAIEAIQDDAQRPTSMDNTATRSMLPQEPASVRPASSNSAVPGASQISSPMALFAPKARHGKFGLDRKAKPAALSLSPIGPSSIRNHNNAVSRARTPPPTNPPTEPLPPLPATANPLSHPFTGFGRRGSATDEDIGAGAIASSTRAASAAAMVRPAGGSRASVARRSPETERWRQNTKPRPEMIDDGLDSEEVLKDEPSTKAAASFSTVPFDVSDEAGFSPPSRSASRPVSRAVAVVAASHLETMAGAERAQAMLRDMQGPTSRAGTSHRYSTGSTTSRSTRVSTDDDDIDGLTDAEESEVGIVQRGTLVTSLLDGRRMSQDPNKVTLNTRAERVPLTSIIKAKERGLGGSGGSSSQDATSSLPQQRRTDSSPSSDSGHLETEAPAVILERERDSGLKSRDSDRQAAFSEITSALKQISAEKRVLQRFFGGTQSALRGSEGENVVRVLTAMSEKLAASGGEIARLLELLERQRSTMDYMLEIHQSEMDSYQDEVEELQEDVDAALDDYEEERAKSTALMRDLASTRAQLAEKTGSHREAVNALEASRSNLSADRANRNDVTEREIRLANELEEARKAAAALLSQHSISMERLRTEHAAASDAANADHERELWDLKEQQEDAMAEVESKIGHKADELVQRHDEAMWTLRAEHAKTVEELTAQIAGAGKTVAEQGVSAAASQSKQKLSAAQADEDFEAEAVESLREPGEPDSPLKKVVHGSPENTLDQSYELLSGNQSLPAPDATSSPAEQIARLQAQLTEQRARESQIRSAYKLLRDEHRRLQQSTHKDRNSIIIGSGNNGGGVSSPGAAAISASAANASSSGFPLNSGTPFAPGFTLGNVATRRGSRPSPDANASSWDLDALGLNTPTASTPSRPVSESYFVSPHSQQPGHAYTWGQHGGRSSADQTPTARFSYNPRSGAPTPSFGGFHLTGGGGLAPGSTPGAGASPSKALKRLSLPLTAGLVSTAANTTTATNSHPNSNGINSVNGQGTRPPNAWRGSFAGVGTLAGGGGGLSGGDGGLSVHSSSAGMRRGSSGGAV
ncbi:unnamed protein product [Jaminaea pallidilutea]